MITMYRSVKAAAAAAAICALTACGNAATTQPTAAEAPEVTGEFKATALDSGKADAIILETDNHTVVIDTGEKDDGDELVAYLQSNDITEIDYLIITHFDKDHVGGAAELIENISIGEIITPDYEGTNTAYEKFVEASDNAGLTATKLSDSTSFTLDDAVFELHPPMRSDYAEEDNDYSIVVNVTHGKNTFMFAGDCETARLAELPQQMTMSHTFLKVPHHGIYAKGLDNFISSVSPKYAVITDSEKHPADSETIALLDGIGCTTYSTQNGTVTAVSDGETITVTQ